jgi:hypothetical protein
MGKKLSDHLDNLSKDSKDVLLNSIEYYKLDLFKKLALSLVSGGHFVLKVGILVLIFFFVSLGFSFLIGNQLGSISYGFFIVGGFYIFLFLVISLFGKRMLERPVLSFLNKILNSEKDLEKELKEEIEQSENSDL